MLFRYLPVAAALLGFASAQVKSDCNPMEKDDCEPNPGFGTEHKFVFNESQKFELWETQVGSVDYDMNTGAKLTIDKQGDSPTLRTKFFFFFGRVELSLKAATGKGIVSSMMMLSEDLDEIDWEFLGSNTTHASTNFFGKGIEDYTNGGWHPMPEPPQDDYHNYTIDWTKEKMDFYIDTQLVRTLNANEASTNGTDTYPQTPMRLSLGIWAGGDPSLPEFTREWAGGDTDFDGGPYDMYVKSAMVTDYSNGKEYVWGDDSGSMESIEIVEGNSTALDAINQKPKAESKSVTEKFDSLPQGAKIGIYAGAAVAGAGLIAALIFFFIKQRGRGAREARLADERDHEMDGFRSDNDTEYKGAGGFNKEALAGFSSYSAVNKSDPDEKSSFVAGATVERTSPGGYSSVNGGADVADAGIPPRTQSPEPAYGSGRMQSYRD